MMNYKDSYIQSVRSIVDAVKLTIEAPRSWSQIL